MAATGTRCNWNAQLLEVLWCGLMETLKDNRAEFYNYSLWNWQTSEDHLKVSVLCAQTSASAL